MKTAIIGALALTLAATPAFGQSATAGSAAEQTFAVSGSINARCTVGSTTPLSFGQINLNNDGTLASGQSRNATLAIYCNGAGSKLKIAGSSIDNTVAAAQGFTNSLALAPTANIGSVTASLSSPAEGVSLGAVYGDLAVSTGDLAASARPMAGDYAGTITVTLTPGL